MQQGPARLVAFLLPCLLGACNTPWEWVAPGVGSAVALTAMLSQSPSTEIEQVYYLGVFDPLEQVPPTIYRVRVRGQASAISRTNFASGWVRSEFIDSLGTNVVFGADTGKLGTSSDDKLALPTGIASGRRMVMFGPEGFREAPRDHRLVVVMGSSPQQYFEAIDQALGEFAEASLDRVDRETELALATTMIEWLGQEQRLADLIADIDLASGGAR